MSGALPYVDEHTLVIGAPRSRVWAALEQHVADSLLLGRGHPLRAVLGTEPPAGFAEAGRQPGRRLELAGRHRFSRYRLTFLVDDAGAGATRLTAVTHAAFPGPHGQAYRLAVIGTRLHRVVTRGILHGVARRAIGLTG